MNKILFDDGREFNPSKIVAVGRNYSEHIKEMHSEKTKQPVLFLKPNSALCNLEAPLSIPQNMGEVHHEIELALSISEDCSNISENEAMRFIAGYGIALDLTLRDIQSEAKKKGLPWAVAKGFDNSCPISKFVALEVSDAQNLEISLIKNGTQMQRGNTNQMIFKVAELISYISSIFSLKQGDIVLTGTPAGVGPLQSGDILQCQIEKIGSLKTKVL
ncbi:MAG: fumarylacetoacetate hydrolase family protein [Calditrichaeota bacterium]|nr:MAG: fumarylacetoacetate hydrolase family protein [Calditrichota bacterium]MBL1205504.1 fumarylacetoacetate hydrolase family protein [Calditrichota bacterium]NOG45332.1 fumarylacetoacetate hydrolase family protein [Calditrichota bacterium]